MYYIQGKLFSLYHGHLKPPSKSSLVILTLLLHLYLHIVVKLLQVYLTNQCAKFLALTVKSMYNCIDLVGTAGGLMFLQ